MADPHSLDPNAAVCCLCELAVGSTARLHGDDLDPEVLSLLQSLGLTRTSEMRLCKNGDPCIVQVRATRIGLSKEVAGQVRVVPTAEPSSV